MLGMLLLGLISGCGPAPPAPQRSESATAAGAADPAGLQQLTERLADAIRSGRADDYRRQLSERDPGFAHSAEMIFDNLTGLSLTRFDLAPTGRTTALGPDRSKTLGPDAYAAEVEVSWALPTDPAPSSQTVWITVLPDGDRLRWAGVADGPAEPRPTPLWWLEPVWSDTGAAATVIGGSRIAADGWATAADHAVGAVRDGLSADGGDRADAHWNGELTVIIPSNDRLLERMLGAQPGAHARLAAISWVDGPQAHRSPIRIMINPAIRLPPNGRRILLAHEALHVATRSPVSSAPTWLVEGMADLIAYHGRPDAERRAAARPVLDRVADAGPPARLPSEDDFSASGADLDRAYAASWLVCRYLDERYGRAAVLDFYHRVDRSGTGRIGPASRAAFGIGRQQLLAGWQDYLVRLSERRR